MKKTFVSVMRRKKNRSGVALVLVLLVLVILAGLVLAFFSTVSSETTASGAESSAMSTKALAENAVNIVTSQIVEATRSGGGDKIQSWVSQPGLIRTFDQSGKAKLAYKLYSAKSLVTNVSGGGFSEEDFTSWKNQPGVFVDINAPVMVTDTQGGTPVANYPIIDPRAATDGGTDDGNIQGFEFTTPPGQGVGQPSPTQNPLPMPVRWLYVLADGKLVPAESGGEGSVNVPGATKANPIRGRIAFWTDDDSCKVNINTASEGVYWDMPHVTTIEDIGLLAGATATKPGLSLCQPAAGEFQRYPGHPATTSLSAVFGNLGLPAPDFARANNDIQMKVASYYNLTPRYAVGGSKGGTVIPDINNSLGSAAAIKNISKRLYSSVDELMFSDQFAGVIRTPNKNSAGANLFTKSKLEKVKFFLTAHSNAPEITVFNTPRISMWPEWDDAALRTTFDKTIAFCSSLGFNEDGIPKWPFYFTRKDSRKMTTDIGLTRNVQLYNYLGKMMAANIPGFGSNFKAKFGSSNVEQLAINIFDYIRCTNIYDYSIGAKPYTTLSTLLSYNYSVISQNQDGKVGKDAGGGEVLPSRLGGIQGFGRIMTINEASLLFFPTDWDHSRDNVSDADETKTRTPSAATLPTYTGNATEMAAVIVFNFSGVMQGLPGYSPNFYYRISGLDGKYNDVPSFAVQTPKVSSDEFGNTKATLDAPIQLFKKSENAFNYVENAPVRFGEGRGIGGSDDPSMIFSRGGMRIFPDPRDPGAWPSMNSRIKTFKSQLASESKRGNFPFFSDKIRILRPDRVVAAGQGVKQRPISNLGMMNREGGATLPNQDRTFRFTGGVMRVDLIAADTNEVFQTLNIEFPAADVRIPQVRQGQPMKVFPIVATSGWGSPPKAGAYRERIDGDRSDFAVFEEDTIISVEVAGRGDIQTDTSVTTNTTVGDLRMTAGLSNVPVMRFRPHQRYALTDKNISGALTAPGFGGKAYGYARGSGDRGPFFGDVANAGPSSGVLSKGMYRTDFVGDITPVYRTRRPNIPSRVVKDNRTPSIGVTRENGDDSTPGDWNTGYGMQKDGPYLNMPDMGDVSFVDIDDNIGKKRYPYLTKEDHYLSDKGGGNYFSPNRQIPSSMMLGSIPTFLEPTSPTSNFQPWTTLLFQAKPEDANHPGRKNPPDYMVADFFWMPVVEPYAISQPFTTAGKINMNYQIQPFTYIKRATGMYAVLKNMKFQAVPSSLYRTYEPRPNTGDNLNFPRMPDSVKTRYAIDVPNTLKQFDQKFNGGDVFRSAAEICDIILCAPGKTSTEMAKFWRDNTVTGDNVREKPYADIYPRLTTKSNTFTVHFMVQALKKVNASGSTAAQWVNNRDQVLGEYRGSTIVERYIDLNDPGFITRDFATAEIGQINIDDFYKFRSISTKRFAP